MTIDYKPAAYNVQPIDPANNTYLLHIIFYMAFTNSYIRES